MLTFLPPGQMPDMEAIKNGTIPNQDGHGYAILIPGRKPRLRVRHGMDAKIILAKFAKDRAKFPDGPALFHSRWGTSGVYGEFNCHPFTVGRDKRTVVAHNGVLPYAMQPDKDDARCDTRLAADQIFSQAYGDLRTSKARKALGDAIGHGNKLVFITADRSYLDSSFIINEDAGIWDNGTWYSNYDYVGYVPQPARTPGPQVLGIGEWYHSGDDCPVCKRKGCIDQDSQICWSCYTCLDCFEESSDCLCYLPVNRPQQAITTGSGQSYSTTPEGNLFIWEDWD